MLHAIHFSRISTHYLLKWNQILTLVSRGAIDDNWDVTFKQMIKEIQFNLWRLPTCPFFPCISSKIKGFGVGALKQFVKCSLIKRYILTGITCEYCSSIIHCSHKNWYCISLILTRKRKNEYHDVPSKYLEDNSVWILLLCIYDMVNMLKVPIEIVRYSIAKIPFNLLRALKNQIFSASICY